MTRWNGMLTLAIACLLGSLPARAELKVVASIMPVHSIVAAVMGDLAKPHLLLSGRLSEHAASFTPSQIADLGEADLVFIVGGGLERKLGQLSGSEAVNGKLFVQLSKAPGVKVLPIREGGSWEPDEDGPELAAATGQDGMVLTFDPHVWLDPENAKAMADAVAAELSKSDPANGAVYAANARAFDAAMDETSKEIAAEIAGVKHKPFIVFHDAYHYFEARFGLHAAGSISDVSAVSPSARRLKEIRDKVTATGAACVFREPQFDDKYVRTIIEGTPAKSGVLDGLGADLAEGPDAYARMLRNLAASLKSCLDE
jgi:zinc transport system substrate-binding protein